MITVFEFLFLLKTRQIIRLIFVSKNGQTITIKGEAFKVMNACIDIHIEMNLIDRIEADNKEIIIYVSSEKLVNKQ